MTDYIQFPRYSIFLTPSQSFFDDIKFFHKINNLHYENLPQSIYGIHYSVKAPFYISHLYTENDLINHFNSLDVIQVHNIFKRSFNIIGLSDFKKNLVLELETDQEFNFFVHDLMRSFDIYRKTLDNEEMKIDLSRYGKLSKKELFYYQIWGYPYYFECGKHHISLANSNPNLKLINFNPVYYESLKLLKQESANESFKEIAVLM